MVSSNRPAAATTVNRTAQLLAALGGAAAAWPLAALAQQPRERMRRIGVLMRADRSPFLARAHRWGKAISQFEGRAVDRPAHRGAGLLGFDEPL
jgi:hypothetical protein